MEVLCTNPTYRPTVPWWRGRPPGSASLPSQLCAALPVAVDWGCLFLDVAGQDWKIACGGGCRCAAAGMLVPAHGHQIQTIFFLGPRGPKFSIFPPCLVCWALSPPSARLAETAARCPRPPDPRVDPFGFVSVGFALTIGGREVRICAGLIRPLVGPAWGGQIKSPI